MPMLGLPFPMKFPLLPRPLVAARAANWAPSHSTRITQWHWTSSRNAWLERALHYACAFRMAHFWHPESGSDDVEDILDAAFVDDEALAMTAASPRLLDRAVSVLQLAVTIVFKALHLEINWGEGKTECILKYRGKSAVAHREQWRQPDGKVRIPVSGCAGSMLSIWQEYRHLGLM